MFPNVVLDISCNIAQSLIYCPTFFYGRRKHDIHYDNKRHDILKRNSGLHVAIIGSYYVRYHDEKYPMI